MPTCFTIRHSSFLIDPKYSLAIRDQRAFELARFLLSEEAAQKHPGDHAALVHAIRSAVQSHQIVDLPKVRGAAIKHNNVERESNSTGSFSYHQEDDELSVVVAVTKSDSDADNVTTERPLLALLVYRPEPILPLCWPSARRAVRFVNAVVSLVTANAFISTLGGGHFLCKHLDQAKLMAKIQIAVSVGLQDPVLESKCRVNLAYGAMQGGRFRRAHRILEREALVAARLESDELQQICHAAKVYLIKTYRLHKEYLRHVSELGKSERLHDNFYRQRIVRAAK